MERKKEKVIERKGEIKKEINNWIESNERQKIIIESKKN
jgi:hypothetical protein